METKRKSAERVGEIQGKDAKLFGCHTTMVKLNLKREKTKQVVPPKKVNVSLRHK